MVKKQLTRLILLLKTPQTEHSQQYLNSTLRVNVEMYRQRSIGNPAREITTKHAINLQITRH